MVKNSKIPERGDIVWIDFSPTKGHEQSGLRPAVVISSLQYNSFSNLVLVCPMTSKRKNYFFEVPIDGPKGKSFVLADQIRSFDVKERVKITMGKVSEPEINEILARASTLFK
ncbi:MAG: type II toxin-antitoxin system PemK/MazF family toxin [Candidatus Paceibacterota bacterium]|jgi:mRNA interferase MazF